MYKTLQTLKKKNAWNLCYKDRQYTGGYGSGSRQEAKEKMRKYI